MNIARVPGQVENAEVRKPKYGSEKKSLLSVSSALLTHVKALQPNDDSIPVM